MMCAGAAARPHAARHALRPRLVQPVPGWDARRRGPSAVPGRAGGPGGWHGAHARSHRRHGRSGGQPAVKRDCVGQPGECATWLQGERAPVPVHECLTVPCRPCTAHRAVESSHSARTPAPLTGGAPRTALPSSAGRRGPGEPRAAGASDGSPALPGAGDASFDAPGHVLSLPAARSVFFVQHCPVSSHPQPGHPRLRVFRGSRLTAAATAPLLRALWSAGGRDVGRG